MPAQDDTLPRDVSNVHARKTLSMCTVRSGESVFRTVFPCNVVNWYIGNIHNVT